LIVNSNIVHICEQQDHRIQRTSVHPFAGVLFFPFTAGGTVDTETLAEHLRRGLAAGPGGVFAACGTGEFHALDVAEYRQVVRTAVEVTSGAVPVFAGTGGPLPMAREFARAAADAGADGLLLMPPYLVAAPPAGLVAYTRAVVQASELPLIAYQRGNAVFDPGTAVEIARIPQVAGLKDGLGDIDLLSRIVTAVRRALDGGNKPFQFFNGMPTAEVSVPAYRGLGVDLYSSAVFCFAPEISLAFYDAVTKQDAAVVDRFLGEFYHPLVTLRNQVPGYAVSLIKAGVRLRGLDAGGVRPPLVDPTPQHLAELERIIGAGLALTGEVSG
jgi:5-dehydro-4-deoxyglucarate dehydratase